MKALLDLEMTKQCTTSLKAAGWDPSVQIPEALNRGVPVLLLPHGVKIDAILTGWAVYGIATAHDVSDVTVLE
jgi:hypothetical protein